MNNVNLIQFNLYFYCSPTHARSLARARVSTHARTHARTISVEQVKKGQLHGLNLVLVSKAGKDNIENSQSVGQYWYMIDVVRLIPSI